MKIHEYQGKEILRQFDVPVPRGHAAFTVDEAVEAAQKLGGPVWVVKAQIHAGGRGKGGGVKVTKTLEGVRELAGQILGMQLKTHQTGPEGQKVRRLYIEDGADIGREFYVSLVTELIDPLTGLGDEQAAKIARAIGMEGHTVDQAVTLFKNLYRCYMETDASLVEINPLNRDSKGNLIGRASCRERVSTIV